MIIIHWLRLLRWQNLLLLALAQFLFFRCIVKPALQMNYADTELPYWALALLILASLSVAAAGYVTNDIHNTTEDDINRPGKNQVGKAISEQHAHNFYLIANFTGIGISIFLAYYVRHLQLCCLFIIAAIALSLYSTWLKKKMIVGHLIIALLSCFSMWVVFAYEPAFWNVARTLGAVAAAGIIMGVYSFLFFVNTLLREIIKSAEDEEGDRIAGVKSIATQFGNTAVRVASAVLVVISFVVVAYIGWYFMQKKWWLLTSYIFVLLCLPHLLTLYMLLFRQAVKKTYRSLSLLLKLEMFFAVLSMLIFFIEIFYA